ncbi:MAG: TonB family protein [Candidatus Zixiibacteriota bacterium]
MAHANQALYSPYGAYELKSRYQKNFMLGTGSVIALVVLVLIVVWVVTAIRSGEKVYGAPTVIKTIAELGPPPTITQRPPQVKVPEANVAAPKIGIPKPVADEEVADEDVTLATKEELAEIVAPDISASQGSDVVVDIQEEEYIPRPDEFVPVEIQPEMIHEVIPEFPRLAKQAGLAGTVWVKALIDKDGNVRDAQVGKSSGTPSLDEAAVKTAFQNKFKPGIQNGRPVICWVTYKVEFKLTD